MEFNFGFYRYTYADVYYICIYISYISKSYVDRYEICVIYDMYILMYLCILLYMHIYVNIGEGNGKTILGEKNFEIE